MNGDVRLKTHIKSEKEVKPNFHIEQMRRLYGVTTSPASITWSSHSFLQFAHDLYCYWHHTKNIWCLHPNYWTRNTWFYNIWTVLMTTYNYLSLVADFAFSLPSFRFSYDSSKVHSISAILTGRAFNSTGRVAKKETHTKYANANFDSTRTVTRNSLSPSILINVIKECLAENWKKILFWWFDRETILENSLSSRCKETFTEVPQTNVVVLHLSQQTFRTERLLFFCKT